MEPSDNLADLEADFYADDYMLNKRSCKVSEIFSNVICHALLEPRALATN